MRIDKHRLLTLVAATVIACTGQSVGSAVGDAGVGDADFPETIGPKAKPATIALGYAVTCAGATDGALFCWGAPSELGFGDVKETVQDVPRAVLNIQTVDRIAVGPINVCARVEDGTARCWGDNAYGTVGDGTSGNDVSPTRVTLPRRVVGLTDATQFAVSGGNACAVRAANAGVTCWGGDYFGGLADGRPRNAHSLVPTDVVALSGVAELVAGGDHFCARVVGATATCWGFNGDGQLGDGTTGMSNIRAVPGPVAGVSGVTQLAAGFAFTCALHGDGSVACWGDNAHGQLGGSIGGNGVLPRQVPGVSGVRKIAAGGNVACAVFGGGSVACWGDNTTMQLGQPAGDSATPRTIGGIPPAAEVAIGGDHACVLTTASEIWCWGGNKSGQLGIGAHGEPVPTPTKVQW